jgi:hypothetical protein
MMAKKVSRMVEPEETAVTTERLSEHFSSSKYTGMHVTIEELLEAVFSVASVHRLYQDGL